MKKIIIYILLLFIFSLFSACSNKEENQKEEDEFSNQLNCVLNYTESYYDINKYEDNNEIIEVDINKYSNDYVGYKFNYCVDYRNSDASSFTISFEFDTDSLILIESDTARYDLVNSNKMNFHFSFDKSSDENQKNGFILFKKLTSSSIKGINLIYENKGVKFITDCFTHSTVVYFGYYPQTHISDSALTSLIYANGTLNEDGYYEYQGEMYYWTNASVSYSTSYSDGTIAYHQNPEWFKVEPIEWRILDIRDDSVMLMSEYLLNGHIFDTKKGKYKKSNIREWLNGSFYLTAFSETEQEAILENEDVYDDKVWLLSKDEIYNVDYGFTDDNSRKGKLTDYAIATDAEVKSSYSYMAGAWWTRDRYVGANDLVTYVVCDGTTYWAIANKDYNTICARPAILISR